MRFDLYHPCIDHLPMVYTMKQLHVLVLPRARSMADACAYSVRGARVFIARAVGVTDTYIHIIIARMQPGLGCLALVCLAIISYRILYCSSLESNYQRL